MGLLSFFKRNDLAPAAKPVAESADAVQQLRTRARRRLIGAAVLVGAGIIGFPLVFETQPRPISVDLPIEIPRKDGAPPLAMPTPPAALEAGNKAAVITESRTGEDLTPATTAQHAAGQGAKTEAVAPVVTAAAPKASAATSKPAAVASAVGDKSPAKTVAKANDKPIDKPVEKPGEKAADKAKDKSREASRAQALLDGKPASAADKKAPEAAGRYIVQVGAFAEANAAREARLKVEKLGLKTYTQVIDNADGKRTRVRVGPLASREEADKAAARIRSAGLSAAILTL